MDYRRDEMRILQDSFWRERVFGFRELSDEKIRKRMECLDLRLEGPLFCVVLFAPYLMEKEADKIDKILIGILNSVREEYRKCGIHCYTISDNYCNIVGILSLNSEEEYRKLNKTTRKMAGDIISRYDVEMFTGIGETVGRISELNKSKDSAAEALAYKFTFSQDHVISAKDVKRYYNQGDVKLKKHIDWVLGCFYDGNLELMEVRLRNLFSAVAEASTNELDSVRNVCIELTATLLRVVREMGVDSSPEMDGIYTYIAQMESVSEIGEWFMSCCVGLLRKVNELRKDKTQQILELADTYIEANLGDPELSLQSISDYVDLSAPYFSTIFYRAKGIHINEYINCCRIQHAQRLLKDTNDKIVNIAKNLGFSSPSYFNNVFKRYTGVSPKRFRENSGRN